MQCVSPLMNLNIFNNKRQSVICQAVVVFLAFATYYRDFADPNLIFWDENYYIASASRYLENIAQFEAHPPLGKLLIAAGDYWIGSNSHQDWQVLAQYKQVTGEQLPRGFNLAGMRIMPALFGMLTALLVYGLMLSLTRQRPFMALLFTAPYLFENAYIVHFRAVHLDSFQLFFSVAVLWLFVDAWQTNRPLHWKHYAAIAAFSGLAIMVKVNAVLLLVLMPVLYWKEQGLAKVSLKTKVFDFFEKAFAAAVAGLLVCATVFAIHLSLGRNLPDINTPSGWDDLAHFSPTYRHFLEHHDAISLVVLMAAAQDYFTFMQKSHLGVPKFDACKIGENGSSPITWPIMDKTINYRWDSNNGETRYLQLVGNPISWALGLFALVASFALVLSHRLFAAPVRNQALYQQIEVFCGFYVAYMGLHVYLASQRVMYLYHYFLGLFVSYILVVLVWQYLEAVYGVLQRQRYWLLGGLMLAVLASFLFIAPLTYHQPLTKPECQLRNVFMLVVECR